MSSSWPWMISILLTSLILFANILPFIDNIVSVRSAFLLYTWEVLEYLYTLGLLSGSSISGHFLSSIHKHLTTSLFREKLSISISYHHTSFCIMLDCFLTLLFSKHLQMLSRDVINIRTNRLDSLHSNQCLNRIDAQSTILQWLFLPLIHSLQK